MASKYDILSLNDALILSQDYRKLSKNHTDPEKRTEESQELEKDFYDINQIKEYNQEYNNEENV